eukprot:123444-Karenia_brevis.AAC.1
MSSLIHHASKQKAAHCKTKQPISLEMVFYSARHDANPSMSGMPTQNLKKKAKANPKYHGWNCFNIALPVVTKNLCTWTLPSCQASDIDVLVCPHTLDPSPV